MDSAERRWKEYKLQVPCLLIISYEIYIIVLVNSFCELAPSLIQTGHYLLSEVFCQDPLERYFSKQRHHGGGNENPTVVQFISNSMILTQQKEIRHDLKTMNVVIRIQVSVVWMNLC